MANVTAPVLPGTGTGGIVSLAFQNAGIASLAGGITEFGQVFAQGALAKGAGLVAQVGSQTVAVQVDVKTTYADGSAKMAVLSVARPDLAAGQSVGVVLSAAPAPSAAAIDLVHAISAHSFKVDMTPVGGSTISIDVLAQLKAAIASGTASFWQKGELATEARVSIDLPGSQRMLFDVTAYKGGGLSVSAQFNNDDAMQAVGGKVSYALKATLDGKVVANEAVTQFQYQNWHETYTVGTSGGQGLGAPAEGWLNIQHDVTYLQKTGVVANYNLQTGVSQAQMADYGKAIQGDTWGDPLSSQGIMKYMPATGGRADIGITTESNTAWLMTGDARAAAYSMGQADGAGSVPIHMWDAAHGVWMNTDNYPKLWFDGRGGVGRPGDSTSGTLVQAIDGASGWTYDTAHQPDLSFVPYVLTGERWILDNLNAQASASIMFEWPYPRQNAEDLVVNGGQVRSSAWSLRQVDQAAWAAPEGSADAAYFKSASDANWKWLVSKIPEWTAMQGEAFGWVPGAYGVKGGLPPWQQDHFASTAIAAASRGNADAMTFLKWEMNFLVGRFTSEAKGFKEHDGAAYLIAISDPVTGVPYKTWAEIGAKTAANGWSNGDGWSKMDGNYGQLALSTLSAIHKLLGDPASKAAYESLVVDGIRFTDATTFANDPTYNLAPPGSTYVPPTSGAPVTSLPPVTTEPPVTVDPPVVTPPPVVAAPTKSMSAGSGPDTLVLKVSEQAYNGDAQFTVKVNGVQVGGVFTSTANHAQGQFDTLTLKGTWGTAALKVEVNFTNDAWGGTATTDRNLYLDGMTYNGKAVPASTVDLLQGGPVSVSVPADLVPIAPVVTPPVDPEPVVPPPVVVPPVTNSITVGTGPDTLVLKVAAQNYQGDPQFTVKVDGVQVGGTFTAKASNALGQFDTLTLKGAWGPDAHKVEVNFINDLWGGTDALDRNLYVNSLTYNGVAVPSSSAALLSSGAITIGVPVTPVPVTTFGTGLNTLELKLAAQSYQGDPQFTVKVDGVQVGGTYTAKANHATGQSETLVLKGAWGNAAHTVEVNFINDLWGGTATTDRNLYILGMTYDGKAVPSSAKALESAGAVKFAVPLSDVTGDGTANIVVGSALSDSLKGMGGNDTLQGGAGNDTLDGGTGSDLMVGGTGDDTFLVDNLGDVVSELPGGGYDRVLASVTDYTLAANVERLDLTGTAITGTGNALDNVLYGNDGKNRLLGLEGNDQLHGGKGDDTLFGAEGNDALYGGDGNDILNGGAGSDTMVGGGGDDTYYVNVLTDRIEEAANGGYDTVLSTISYTLGSNLERLDLSGSALNGTGNELANVLTGNALNNLLNGLAGNDKLSGGGGNDTLVGGLGTDTLEGGSGADSFRYGRAAEGGDVILDFVRGSDFIEVSASGFGGGLTVGSGLLAASRFASNTTGLASAPAGTGQFVYETDAAKLWWDADGSGGAAGVVIASFTAGTSFGIGDIHLFG